jgi:GntR family transcriptional regulator
VYLSAQGGPRGAIIGTVGYEVPDAMPAQAHPSVERANYPETTLEPWISVDAVGREGPTPAYIKIRDSIAEKVSVGELEAGDRLPPERELCAMFGVSRVTLRMALKALAQAGILTPSNGRGWYVRGNTVQESLNELSSFTALAESTASRTAARLITREIRRATAGEARDLGLNRKVEVLRLDRLRLIDDVPIAYSRSILPLPHAPILAEVDFSDPTVSLYQVLRSAGLVPTHADVTIQALDAPAEIAELLEVAEGASLLSSEQKTYDQHDRLIELGSVSYRGDRHRFRATLRARDGYRLSNDA